MHYTKDRSGTKATVQCVVEATAVCSLRFSLE